MCVVLLTIQIEASVFAHMVEECKRLIVEMCGPVLERAFSEPSFTNLLLDSLDETTSEST